MLIASNRAAGPADRVTIENLTRFLAYQRSELEKGRELLAHDSRMKAKYARAAERPWITVPHDPPGPGFWPVPPPPE